MAEWIAAQTGAGFGYLTEAANTVGAALACPRTEDVFEKPAQAYLLLHAEPGLDCANPVAAQTAAAQARMIVVMSPFKHSMDFADVMLPIAPFTETSGSFINAEGRVQSFHAAVSPLGETRPGWKVLRVLGNILNLDGFEHDSSEQVRDAITHGAGSVSDKLNNVAQQPAAYTPHSPQGLERISDVPIYFADPIVRRAASLQKTADARAPKARMASSLMQQLGVANGDGVRITQDGRAVYLTVQADDAVGDGVVRIAAADRTTLPLGPLFGSLTVERAA
jgi:NADH-quinone oxidoreductase subunit G